MENNKHTVFLEFDLPGFNRDEININIEETKITVKAKAKHDKETLEKGFERFEEKSQDFYYSSTLPPVQKDKAEIEFYGGTLEITIPKK